MVKSKMRSLKNFILNNKAILVIATLAFILRIWGVTFGLPYNPHPDEPFYIEKALNFFTGDFNPHWFGHPGSTVINTLFLIYVLFFIFGASRGHFSNSTQFIKLFKNYPTPYFLLGRIILIFFGAINIYLLYKIVRKLFNQQIAVLSAIVFTIAPLHVRYSRIIRTDITQTMFILATIYFFISYLESKRKKDLFIGSIFFGFSVATKWPSLLLIIPF